MIRDGYLVLRRVRAYHERDGVCRFDRLARGFPFGVDRCAVVCAWLHTHRYLLINPDRELSLTESGLEACRERV
jgi:hypothetical protein